MSSYFLHGCVSEGKQEPMAGAKETPSQPSVVPQQQDVCIWIEDFVKNNPLKEGWTSSAFPDDRRHQEEQPGGSAVEENLMYRVPANIVTAKNKARERMFYPVKVSIGLVHYNRFKDANSFSCMIKKEAVAKIMGDGNQEAVAKIMGDCKQEATAGFTSAESKFKELVEMMEKLEDKIRNCYRHCGDIRIGKEDLAMIMVVDACFLLAALSILSAWWSDAVDMRKWPRLAVLKREHTDGLRQQVMQDMLKMENQIPLWVVRNVAENLPGWEPTVTEISKKVKMGIVLAWMNPFESYWMDPYWNEPSSVRRPRLREKYENNEGHLLCLVHLAAIDEEEEPKKEEEEEESSRSARCVCNGSISSPQSMWKKCVDAVVSWIPNRWKHIAKEWSNVVRFMLTKKSLLPGSHWCAVNLAVNLVTLLLILVVGMPLLALALALALAALVPLLLVMLPMLFMALVWPNIEENAVRKVPNVRQLVEQGVDIVPSLGGLYSISAESNDQLRLPVITMGYTTKVVLTNMVAWEFCSSTPHKLITDYACLMKELLATDADVREMESRDLLDYEGPVSEKPQEVHRTWQELAQTAQEFGHGHAEKDAVQDTIPDNKNPVTQAAKQLYTQLQKKPYGVWSTCKYWIHQLGRDYAKNPWVALSTAAAVLMIFMTIAQVLCLFVACPAAGGGGSGITKYASPILQSP